MYKYLFYNPGDVEIVKFLSRMMVLGKDSIKDCSIERIQKDLVIELFGVRVLSSLKVSIGEVIFANSRIDD